VDGFGDQFLAGPTLALQQYRRAAGGHLRHQVEDAQHGLALADDVLEVVALLQGALELDDFFFSAAAAHGGANIGQQFLVVPGLLDEVGGAGLHRIHGVFHRAVGGDHDDRQFGIALANVVQHLNAIALRQSKIQQYQIVGTFGDARQALFAVIGGFHRVAFKLQQSLQRLANGSFVVDDEHRSRARRSSRGRRQHD
jgi:hypothetical protein